MSNHNDKIKQGLSNNDSEAPLGVGKNRKVQISLDFPDAADTLLRTLAACEHKAPSSMVREIVGLPTSPPKRARIGVSLNDEELGELGGRYNVDPSNKAAIRRKLTEEVTSVLNSSESLDYGLSEPTPTTALTSEERAFKSASKGLPETSSSTLKQSSLEKGDVGDLQTISNAIHQRFQRTLAKRGSK